MSHQSGITVSSDLSAKFVSAQTTTTRLFQVNIVNEALEATHELPAEGTFEEDFGRIPELLEDNKPSYILVRTDPLTPAKWIFCTYVPDTCKVREKMLYASTRASVTKMFGESNFVDSLYASTKDELSFEGYLEHKRHKESEAPLSEREREMAMIREMEDAQGVSSRPTMDTRQSHVAGVMFALDEEANIALKEFASGVVNFVILKIHNEQESIVVDRKESLQDHAELARVFPEDNPRFAFYWYDNDVSLFVYSCPTSSSIRDRMLYSSCRAGLLQVANELSVKVSIKMEVDHPADELKTEELDREVRSLEDANSSASNSDQKKSVLASKQKFRRPAPPGRRPRTQPTA